MKKISARQVALVLLGPWMILPQAFLVAGLVGGVLYEPPELHRQFGKHIFLQGSTDMGGGCLFAGTVALFVAFGLTAAWYLSLKLQEAPTPTSFRRALGRSLSILKYHILAFIVGGTGDISYDARVTPNDFRNIFLWACLIYGMSVLLIAALNSTRLRLSTRLLLAPLFTFLWLSLGSDGNTLRAGQLVQSGQDPQPIVRGLRHGIMVGWHQICDGLLGDVGERGCGASDVARWLSGAATLAFFLILLAAGGRYLVKKTRVPLCAYWSGVFICITAVMGVTIASRYMTFRADRNVVVPVMNQVRADISLQTIDRIKADAALDVKEVNLIEAGRLGASVVAEIDRVFRPEYFRHGLSIVLLVPTEDDSFLFIWQNPLFRYADVRRLAGLYSRIADYDEIRLMLDRRRDFTTPFLPWEEPEIQGALSGGRGVLAGGVVLDSSGRVACVVVVSRQ